MIELPSTLDHIVAGGWPWHGQLKQKSDRNRDTYPGGITLADGTLIPVKGVRLNQNTLLFDRGFEAPETPEVISAKGGEWWGQAIIRFGSSFNYGGGLDLRGLPILIPPEYPDDPIPPPFFGYPGLDSGVDGDTTLRWRFLQAGQLMTITQPISAAALGQVGQSPAYGFSNEAQLGLIDDQPRFGFEILDLRMNEILGGIVGVSAIPSKPKPGGAAPSGSTMPGAWSGQYIGLARITVVSREEVQFELLEDRDTALGHPVRTVVDEREGAAWPYATWNYSDEVVVTGALITAWFAEDGSVKTVRYNRTDRSTLQYLRVSPAGTGDSLTSEISTAITLLTPDGGTVDEIELSKRVAWSNGEEGFTYSATIQRNDDEPSVVTYALPQQVNMALPVPFATIDFGVEQMFVNMLGQTLDLGSGTNVLEPQGYRTIWIARLSNKACALCFSYEASPYEAGAPSEIELDAGPAVSPAGIHGERITRTATYPAPGENVGRRYGFFNEGSYTFVIGSYNPVTGQLARHDLENHLSWA